MKTNLKLFQRQLSRAVALGTGLALGLTAAAADSTFSDANWMSMGLSPGPNGPVMAAAVDGAGNLYIGGSFTIVGDALADNIAKWDGNRWSAVGSRLNGSYYAVY